MYIETVVLVRRMQRGVRLRWSDSSALLGVCVVMTGVSGSCFLFRYVIYSYADVLDEVASL